MAATTHVQRLTRSGIVPLRIASSGAHWRCPARRRAPTHVRHLARRAWLVTTSAANAHRGRMCSAPARVRAAAMRVHSRPFGPRAHIRRELSEHYACPMAAPWCDFMAARGHRHGHMVHARLAPMRAASIQQTRPAQHARAKPRADRDNVAEYVMGMLHRCCAT